MQVQPHQLRGGLRGVYLGWASPCSMLTSPNREWALKRMRNVDLASLHMVFVALSARDDADTY